MVTAGLPGSWKMRKSLLEKGGKQTSIETRNCDCNLQVHNKYNEVLSGWELVDADFESILEHDGQGVDLHLSHPLLKNETTAEVTELFQQEVPL